ncbi:MAG: Dabb family protein [Rhodoferax sp.]|nr:Dabb family protein [Rhodoferax sp.]
MLNHIVMFRRKAETAADPVLENALVARMDGLGTQVPDIRSWRLSANELDRPICWGYVLESGFDDADGLNAYLFHPLHQALIADLKTYFEWAAVDYTV